MAGFFLFAVLGGCSTWLDGQPACNLGVYSWSDDLLAHILTGEGDGVFSYDPEDVPRVALDGKYDVENGDFSWTTDYADTYFLRNESVEGYGTSYHNGDLDLLYTRQVEDMLGESSTSNVRTKRTGCSMTIARWSEEDMGDLRVESGTYSDDETYQWEGTYGDYALSGALRSNLSHTLAYSLPDGSVDSFTAYKPEGTADEEVSGAWDNRGRTFEATVHTRFDGGREGSYTVLEDDGSLYLNLTTNYAYDGSGTETQVDADGGRCDLVVAANGDCSYSCDDGSSGSC